VTNVGIFHHMSDVVRADLHMPMRGLLRICIWHWKIKKPSSYAEITI